MPKTHIFSSDDKQLDFAELTLQCEVSRALRAMTKVVAEATKVHTACVEIFQTPVDPTPDDPSGWAWEVRIHYRVRLRGARNNHLRTAQGIHESIREAAREAIDIVNNEPRRVP